MNLKYLIPTLKCACTSALIEHDHGTLSKDSALAVAFDPNGDPHVLFIHSVTDEMKCPSYVIFCCVILGAGLTTFTDTTPANGATNYYVVTVLNSVAESEDMALMFPLTNQDQTFALHDDDLVSALVGTCMTDGRQEQIYVLNHSTGCSKEAPYALEHLLDGFKLLRLPSRLMALLVAALILGPACLSLRLLPLWLALPAFWCIKRYRKRPVLETLRNFTQEMVQKIINSPLAQEVWRPPKLPDIQLPAAGPFWD